MFDDIYFCSSDNQGGNNKTSRRLNKNLKFDVINVAEQYKSPCEMLWNRLHLTSEGHLTACCIDYENDLIYSENVFNKDIYEEFNNDLITEFRDKHLKKKLENLKCYSCVYNRSFKYKKLKNLKNHEISLNEKKLQNLDERIKIIEDFKNH